MSHQTRMTAAQIRRLRLLTLAQMVHLESIGIGMTGRSAKRQAIEALDLNHASGAATVETLDLLEGLRAAANASIGIEAAP